MYNFLNLYHLPQLNKDQIYNLNRRKEIEAVI